MSMHPTSREERAGNGDRHPVPRPRPSVLHTAATAAVETDDEIRELSESELLARIERLRRERMQRIEVHLHHPRPPRPGSQRRRAPARPYRSPRGR